ncbi:hypothetical protein KXV56_001783 [Aspergillus fumigatus]|nr:hypothetical protein KXX36_003638 [Aspergillus fumigatus]KAH2000029.1 hypothetical protein KXV80_003588 [Aspergillus fumigatus]KAH3419507.1 hypothetical protein KXW09_004292 [Aspergillus fumigatus]KAH3456464.1 hypothetical protein KXV91_008828 [Aspergillus fumigatus]KAH3627858.1 hypothetical protein KXV56_001783 [Aspergillus fumigatus]
MSFGTLHIRDSRTNAEYEIPIRRNAVVAMDFKRIKAPAAGADRADQVDSGLRVHDPGLQNTTVRSLEETPFVSWVYFGTAMGQRFRRYAASPCLGELSYGIAEEGIEPEALGGNDYGSQKPYVPESIPASTKPDLYQSNSNVLDRAIIRTVAAYAVVFGLVNCHRRGIPFAQPSRHTSYLENLFHLAGLVDQTTGRPDPTKLSCFQRFAMLNADHGMALSVFSALVTASSLTDPISCLITATGAAFGPLHFGATESANLALRVIGTPENVPNFIEEVKQGKQRLFGYGHRSYKGVDPRVAPIRSILKDLDMSSNSLLKVAERIEQVASADDYFRNRGLYPNADFYGNFVFTEIGFEPDMIPAAMMAQRIMGVMAHWREYMWRSSISQPPATDSTPLLSSHAASQRFSVFTNGQKRLIILAAALASSFSPFSANIYYPSLNSIAADLHVTSSQINLTITTYMICQGLAPSFMSSFADQAGRRPAYIVCFVIYIIGNIALALQHNYIALLALRAVQSCGSSGTVALASAVAADVITSAERGMYMGITSLGNILAPSLGPILGGFLSQYLGWQAIFWLLAFAAVTFFIPLVIFFPETCRTIVGDGSIPATGWNQSVWNRWHKQQTIATSNSDPEGTRDTCRDSHPRLQKTNIAIPNPLSTISLLFQLPTGPLVLANGIVFASYYSVTAGIPSQFKATYGLSDLGIGLSFIPAGLGSLLSATLNGLIVDWNYIRLRRKTGDIISKDQKQDHGAFPIERTRLQIGLPMTVAAALSVAWYGALIESKPPLNIALALVLLISFCITAAYNVMNVLIVDLYYTTPATAMAANNLVRCFLGAAATAVIHPMILKWGNRTTYLAVAGAMLSVTISSAQWALPQGTPTLQMRYPSTPWISPGDTIKQPDALPIPCIRTLNLNAARTYLLLFVDIDVVLESCSTTVLHWYQPYMTASATSHCDGNENGWLVNRTSTGAEYIAPQSPPYTRHRYVYLLYEQDPDFVFPDCFGHIFPPTREGRGGFDIKQFVEVAGLRPPVAGNFFYVDNDAATTTTTASGGLVPTTTWFISAPCRTAEPKSTGFSPMGGTYEVDQQQVVI